MLNVCVRISVLPMPQPIQVQATRNIVRGRRACLSISIRQEPYCCASSETLTAHAFTVEGPSVRKAKYRRHIEQIHTLDDVLVAMLPNDTISKERHATQNCGQVCITPGSANSHGKFNQNRKPGLHSRLHTYSSVSDTVQALPSSSTHNVFPAGRKVISLPICICLIHSFPATWSLRLITNILTQFSKASVFLPRF